MRNFGSNQRNIDDLGRENAAFPELAASPDQVAVVWNGSNEAVAATPMPGNTAGTFEVDIARFPADFNLAGVLNMRRGKQGSIPPLSQHTLFLTSVPDFSERTRILALDGEKLAMSDDELAEWLVQAEQQMFLGTDNHPLFETSLEDTACTVRRLPNGRVAMTEVPRQHVTTARERIRVLLGERTASHLNLCVETPLRCAARYFLTALPEGERTLSPARRSEVTAFFVITKSGYSYGLWSSAAGMFSEYGFLAPKEINRRTRGRDGQFATQPPAAEAGEEIPREQLEDYVRYAIDQLFLQLSREKLDQLELTDYSQVVWAAEAGLSDIVAPIAGEYSEQHGLKFIEIEEPIDEAVAGGLLFGSFTFGSGTVAGADILPPVNLARDIMVLADREELERRHLEEAMMQRRRNSAAFALLAAPVIVLAGLLALGTSLIFSQIMTTVRDARAEAHTQELKPALDRRNSYEANLKWYQEFIKQVSRLRRQQPVGIGMLHQLNPNYPFSIDPSFYVSDMKLQPNGTLEIKGLARNKDAITSFLKSLEFAGGAESGSRLFSNLAYEVQESAPVATPAGQAPLPTMTGSQLAGKPAAPGTIAWSIKGNYVPMAEFAPPDPNAKPAPAAATPAAAPAKPAA